MAVKVYFGVPGAGKTTIAAKVAKRCHKKGIKCFANFPCAYTYLYDPEDLGKWSITDCVLIIDEAAIDFNNRSYKTLPHYTIKFLKLYRHYGISEIIIFSQSYEDFDVTLRRLATEYFLVTRPGRWFIKVKQAVKKIDIDKETHQFYDAYFWRLIPPSFVFGPFYWKLFDSWDAPALPVKDFPYNPGKQKVTKRNNCFVT